MQHLPIKPAHYERLLKGYPWVYTDAFNIKNHLEIEPGDLVALTYGKKPFAIAYFNPLTKIACRIISWDPNTPIDETFFLARFKDALARRERIFNTPFYRLVHAESDNLPGLIIDRFNHTFVCQTNTAGMEKLKPLWFSALTKLFSPHKVIFRDDSPVRTKEGLPFLVSAPIGELNEQIPVEENGLTFYADPFNGQKTGWFFDQRANRLWVSQRSHRKTVLDLYSYHGGFGVLAASNAAKVSLVDSSEKALHLAHQAAITNQVASKCDFIREDVFDLLPKLIEQNQQFDIVVADPPAFVKLATQQGAGLRGYQKLAKLASSVVAPNGILFIASCSHHASHYDFRQAVEAGIAKANRQASLIRKGGASPDHPAHRLLPQTQYLKSLAYRIS